MALISALMRIRTSGILFSAAVLLAINMQGHAHAYSFTTGPADLSRNEIDANLGTVAYDEGDVYAHDGYGEAIHDTSEWNQLGRSNIDNDGVQWSVNGGAFGTDEIIVTGAFTIQFQISLWSAGYGRHHYDQVKAWVDWNNNQVFENDNLSDPSKDAYLAGETILAAQYYKKDDQIADERGEDEEWRIDRNLEHDTMTIFTTEEFTVTEAMLNSLTLGGYWLRARSQCDHEEYNTMTPYDYLWQGEAEDYFIKVTYNNEVPEPATMLLFGTGVFGLAAFRRRKKI